MIRRYDFHSDLMVYGFTPRIRLVLLEQAFGAELPLFPNSVEKFERGNHKRDQNRKFSNIFDKRFHRKDQHSVRPRESHSEAVSRRVVAAAQKNGSRKLK